jgi:putative membrane protein
MGIKAEKFFSDGDKTLIDSAIREVESKSSGEIVVMVVDSSDRYADVDSIIAVIAGALISIYPAEIIFLKSHHLITKYFPLFNWSASIPEQTRFAAGLLAFMVMCVAVFFPMRYILSRFPAVKRLFLSDRRMDWEVRERAIRAFHQHGLHQTRDETGILFLISLLERKVYVLADKGIYSRIHQSDLDGFSSTVAGGIAKKQAAEALAASIRALGADLAKHFPRKPDDTNELPDEIITGN